MKKQIFKNLASNYLATLFGLCLAFLSIPFLIQKLGKEAYGVIVLAESLIALSQVLNGSIRISLSRYAAYSLGEGNSDRFMEYISAGRRLLSGLGLFVFLLGTFISWNFPRLFAVPAEQGFQSRFLFFTVTLAMSVSIPNDAFWAILYAHQRFDLINFSNSAALLLKTLAIFALYAMLSPAYADVGLYGVIFLAVTLGQNACIYFWSVRLRPRNFKMAARFHGSKAKEILSYSGHTVVASISSALYENTINVLINLFIGPAANAVYAISTRIPAMLKRLFVESTWTLTPTFTNLAAKGDALSIQKMYVSYSKLMAIVTAPICIMIALLAEGIITQWVGPEFRLAAGLLPWLSLSVMLSIPPTVCFCVTSAYGLIKIPSRVSLAAAVANLGLSAFFGFYLGQGLMGIAISSLLVAVLGTNAFMPFYASKILALPPGQFWKESILKPFILFGAISFLFLYPIRLQPHFSGTLGGMALLTAVYCALCYAAAWRLLVDEPEKKIIQKSLNYLFEKLAFNVPATGADRHADL